MSINWPRFVELVRSPRRFTLTSHIRPDCDALGSELGMAAVLTALGKEVRIVNAHGIPPHLKFIDPDRKIQVLESDVAPALAADTDAILVLDTCAWVQLGGMAEVLKASSAVKLVLDHHVSHDDLGAERFIDSSAEATGRLVVDAADQLGVPLTAEMARPLFAALTTDTGWFRFNSTTGGTLHCAARLIEAGANPAQIYAQLYEQDSLARIQLTGLILGRTESHCDGRLVCTTATRDDFARTGALVSDTEDVVNLTLRVRGAEVALIFVEQPQGGTKVSIRSRSAFDCSALAEKFGGGGHRAAAGCVLPGGLADSQRLVLDEARARLR